MSASAKPRFSSQPIVTSSRDIRLRIVPTPAPKQGFVATALICAAIVLGAFVALFILNTSMVKTAFEIQSVQKETNLAYSTEATLEDEILRLSSPNELSKHAKELGLTPASEIRHIDLAAETVVE
ncbi:MAG: hypothetical protein IKS49_04975 [Actinomycetaceae bacterium]|nr:hypothetical protein [Actinomycetaceae bacterium]